MDSLIAASARALAAGDALGALKRVALRDDPPALALRGIGMAQLGDYPRARELLRRAARAFGAHEALAQARCVVAEAEVALAMREFAASPRALDAAADTLQAHADHGNAMQARLIALRRLLLLGRLDEAAAALRALDATTLSPALETVAALAAAELDLRVLRVAPARQALARAQVAASRARVPALLAEVARAHASLEHPAARRIDAEGERALRLADVEATPRGFALRPRGESAVVLLAPPIEGEQGALLALLSDGAPWSTSALALAVGASQRSVQRALAELEADGRVRAIGQARA